MSRIVLGDQQGLYKILLTNLVTEDDADEHSGPLCCFFCVLCQRSPCSIAGFPKLGQTNLVVHPVVKQVKVFHKMVCRIPTRHGVDYINRSSEIQNYKEIGDPYEDQRSWSPKNLIDLVCCDFSERFAVSKLLGARHGYRNFVLQLVGPERSLWGGQWPEPGVWSHHVSQVYCSSS